MEYAFLDERGGMIIERQRKYLRPYSLSDEKRAPNDPYIYILFSKFYFTPKPKTLTFLGSQVTKILFFRFLGTQITEF